MSEHEDENITSDHEKLPTHEFMVRKSTIQTGPSKGEERILVSLVITPYVFKQKSKPKGSGCTASFACNGCAKVGFYNTAKAMYDENDEGSHYYLTQWPKEHKCVAGPAAV